MKTRVISAFIACVLLIAVFLIFRINGLYAVCSLVAIGINLEYSRIMFKKADAQAYLRVSFLLLSLSVFAVSVLMETFAFSFLMIATLFFLTMVLMTIRTSEELPHALQIMVAGVLGFVYCGAFPATAVRTLALEGGAVWLFGLMAIVFAGDTFAYLTGVRFGKHKLLEPVSPKKTIEGSIGGLAGSALTGAVLGHFFLPEYQLVSVVFLALVTGAFAQVGDLFESLLKRLAEVKDSGSIMPGHGGLLDRIDGILFAAPVYYVLARFLV